MSAIDLRFHFDYPFDYHFDFEWNLAIDVITDSSDRGQHYLSLTTQLFLVRDSKLIDRWPIIDLKMTATSDPEHSNPAIGLTWSV